MKKDLKNVIMAYRENQITADQAGNLIQSIWMDANGHQKRKLMSEVITLILDRQEDLVNDFLES